MAEHMRMLQTDGLGWGCNGMQWVAMGWDALLWHVPVHAALLLCCQALGCFASVVSSLSLPLAVPYVWSVVSFSPTAAASAFFTCRAPRLGLGAWIGRQRFPRFGGP